jgi:hypothetical protein
MRFLALLPFVALTACATPDRSPIPPDPTQASVDATDIGPAPDLASVKPAIEQTIRERMRDPDSAKFRWDEAQRPTKKWYFLDTDWNRGVAWRFLVDVNGRNAYGGFTGFERWEALVWGTSVVSVDPASGRTW